MYSVYKLNKQSDNIQPWCTPYPIWNQSVVPCPVLTVASWPAYRFHKRQGQVVWYSHLLKTFPQFVVIHCLFRNLYAGQEATVTTGHGTTDWLQIGKGVRQGCILSPCLFNFYAEYIMRNAGLDEALAGIKIAGEISITSDMQMTPPLWQKVKRSSKASWWKWKRRVKTFPKAQHSENLDHGMWSHHFMVNRWGNSGNSVRLYCLGLQNHCR